MGNSVSLETTDTYERQPNKRTKNDTKDDYLTAIIEAWPTLPEAIRAGIAAMVKAATDRESAE